CRRGSQRLLIMRGIMKKLIYSAIALTFAATALFAQSPSPAESPAASPAKHKHSKKKETTESAAAAQSPASSESPATSPAEKKKRSKKKETNAAESTSAGVSPAAASPSPAKRSWFKRTTASPSPAAAPMTSNATTASGTKATKEREPMGTPAPGGGPGMVWVNTETHVYHKEGSRWYGHTKKGKYVTER